MAMRLIVESAVVLCILSARGQRQFVCNIRTADMMPGDSAIKLSINSGIGFCSVKANTESCPAVNSAKHKMSNLRKCDALP